MNVVMLGGSIRRDGEFKLERDGAIQHGRI